MNIQSVPSFKTIQPEDLTSLITLEALCHPHPWSPTIIEGDLLHPCAFHFGLTIEDQIIGYILSLLVVDELQINNVAIDPHFRKRGLATLLVKHLLDQAKVKLATKAILEVRISNNAAIKTYEKCGFSVDSKRIGYYQNGEDALLMSRLL